MNKTAIKTRITEYYRSSREYFDKLDVVFDERGSEAYRRGSFDVLEYVRDARRILDIGCGSGALLAFLRERYSDKEYFGIDVSPIAIEKCRERNSGPAKSITFAVGDVEREIPFGENTFDLIIAHEVIEHFVEPDTAILNSARALKQNGHLYLIAPNRLIRSSVPIIVSKLGDYFRMVIDRDYIRPTIINPPLDIVGGDSDAVYVANPWELHRMVRKAGLRIVKKSHLKCRIVARKS